MIPARLTPRRDDGFAMYTVIMVMMVILVLAASMANGSVATITGVNKDEVATRAFQAAEAGAQTALHRINLIQPAVGQCVTTAAANPQAGSNWCAATSPESIGNGQYFTYQTSTQMDSGCTGTSFGATYSERCIVATGTVSGVSRRVILRVVSSSGIAPFPVAGVLGLNSVTLSNNARISGSVGTNGQLTMGNNSRVTGSASLWTNAPNPVIKNGASITGGQIRGPQFQASRPNMLNPATGGDSATSNDNARLLAGASPADTCSSGGGTCYTNTVANPRELVFANNKSVTLGGAVYNFCKVAFNNGATMNVAAGATVIVFLDSPNRPGSGCKTGQGTWVANNNAIFQNPSGDASKFQIISYGNTTATTITWDNNLTFTGTIYAPFNPVVFTNNANLVGGITAQSVSISNNGTWDSRAGALRFATTFTYYRGAWRQCNSVAQSATAPATGCL